VSITGEGAADDSATIYVNGVLVVGQTLATDGATNAFTLNASNATFNSGSNTITFRVNNVTNKSTTGLMISSFSGTVIVPETAAGLPAAVAVLVSGAVAFLRRRRKQGNPPA
jgi:hypothetical protein